MLVWEKLVLRVLQYAGKVARRGAALFCGEWRSRFEQSRQSLMDFFTNLFRNPLAEKSQAQAQHNDAPTFPVKVPLKTAAGPTDAEVDEKLRIMCRVAGVDFEQYKASR